MKGVFFASEKQKMGGSHLFHVQIRDVNSARNLSVPPVCTCVLSNIRTN